jgi:NAD(P)-dependent dehydrogenase (short-subunit alcohol dehydrogenase family)
MTDEKSRDAVDRRNFLTGVTGLLAALTAGRSQAGAHDGAEIQAPAPGVPGVEPLPAPATANTTVLITGSNRGLGLEFVKIYANRGWRVIATCREPGTADALNDIATSHPDVMVEQLDVIDHDGIDALAARYRNWPVDILVNNAGIGGGSENQLFGRLNYPVFNEVMAVNAVGPIKLAEAFMMHVRASTLKKIMTVSSSQGSIASVRSPMLYWYRASKSAVNMLMTNLTFQVRRRGVIVGLVTPGATATDFIAPRFRKRIPGIREPAEAAADMVRNIDRFTIEMSGSFVNYNGDIIPW